MLNDNASEKQQNPPFTARRPNNALNNQFAVYVVGCLVHAGCIKFDVTMPEEQQAENILSAARIIKACLDQYMPVSIDYPELPFKW